MAMSPEVQREYDFALTKAIIFHGSVVESNPSTYGWSDYEETEHLRRCGGHTSSAVEEDSWHEFVDTWNGSEEKHGLGLTGVSCLCGRLKDRKVRWQADRSEIAEAVFAAALGYRA